MYRATSSGKTNFTHSTWHIVAVKDRPNCFTLKTNTGHVVCRLTFSKPCDSVFLNLIAAAPELKDIVEMYRDAMVGSTAEKTMLFEIVSEILNRITQNSV